MRRLPSEASLVRPPPAIATPSLRQLTPAPDTDSCGRGAWYLVLRVIDHLYVNCMINIYVNISSHIALLCTNKYYSAPDLSAGQLHRGSHGDLHVVGLSHLRRGSAGCCCCCCCVCWLLAAAEAGVALGQQVAVRDHGHRGGDSPPRHPDQPCSVLLSGGDSK